MLKYWILSVGLGVIGLVSLSFADSKEVYHFNSSAKQEIFLHITRELRCLVCQNQTIYDSKAPLAEDLKHQIYTQLQNGQSEHEIIYYLTQRYGDFILYTPPLRTYTYFLWFFPGLLLIASGAILVFLTKKNKSQKDKSIRTNI